MMAGRLRKTVTIEQVTETRDSMGGVVETWATLDKVRAEIRPMRGRELWDAQRVNPELTHVVTIRFLEGVDAKMRVTYTDDRTGFTRHLLIDGVIDVAEAHREMQLYCHEWKRV
jgi:SPP1 family predicted phage head-tail adaptor